MENILLGAMLLVVLSALSLVFWRAGQEVQGFADTILVSSHSAEADP